MSQDPCPCHACVVANVGRPAIRIPAYKNEPAHELHGVELRKHYEAMDELKAAIEKFKREKGDEVTAVLSKRSPDRINLEHRKAGT